MLCGKTYGNSRIPPGSKKHQKEPKRPSQDLKRACLPVKHTRLSSSKHQKKKVKSCCSRIPPRGIKKPRHPFDAVRDMQRFPHAYDDEKSAMSASPLTTLVLAHFTTGGESSSSSVVYLPTPCHAFLSTASCPGQISPYTSYHVSFSPAIIPFEVILILTFDVTIGRSISVLGVSCDLYRNVAPFKLDPRASSKTSRSKKAARLEQAVKTAAACERTEQTSHDAASRAAAAVVLVVTALRRVLLSVLALGRVGSLRRILSGGVLSRRRVRALLVAVVHLRAGGVVLSRRRGAVSSWAARGRRGAVALVGLLRVLRGRTAVRGGLVVVGHYLDGSWLFVRDG